MSQLIRVGIYKSEMDAEVAATVLRAEGIEPFLNCDDAGGFEPQLQLTRGVELLVDETDYQQAREVLDSAADTSE